MARSIFCATRSSTRRQCLPRSSMINGAVDSKFDPRLKTCGYVSFICLTQTSCLRGFSRSKGVAELTDYMPIQKDSGQPNQIVRIVSVITGNVKFKMSCQPRFNYAASDHELQSSDCCATFFPAHKDCPPMSLYSSVAIETRSQDISAEFSLQAGESATFVLGGLRAEGEQPEMDLLRQRFLETAQFWKTWVSKSNYKGRWREMVHRSALVLKLLTSRKHGSLIAAATFSLPESIGGVRNWDYRFTWLRDAAFTLYALIRL